MTHTEALKLALGALELINIEFVCGNGSHNSKKDRHEWDEPCPITDRWKKAITAVQEALAQPEQKPVAWMDADGNVSDNNDHNCFSIPLYTFPPQRKWVGLTVEEIAYFSYVLDHWTTTHIKGIEAKLKEKNT